MNYEIKLRIKRRYRMALQLFIIASFVFVVSENFVQDSYNVASDKLAIQMDMDNQIATAQDATTTLNETIALTEKTFENLWAEKDTYIESLGTLAVNNQLNIHRLTADEISPLINSYLYTLPVQIEVQGTLNNISTFTKSLYDEDALICIDAMSYRLDNQPFAWMWRTLDDEPLLDWWDISAYEEAVEEHTPTLAIDPLDLSIATLMENKTALCYIELNFIGQGGT